MYSSYLGIYAARNEDLMVKIGILGAGSWGLGLAMLLNNNGHEVTVWSVFPDEIKELDETRENKRCLPGVIFPEHIKFNADTEYVIKNSDVLILAVASPYTRSTAKLIAPFVKEGQYIVNVGKGIEEHTLKTLCEVTKDEIPQAVIAVLSGPSHAEEVGRGIPTTCVIGTAKKADAQFLQNVFMSNVFRVYISPDVLGICIGGALKNVIALAAPPAPRIITLESASSIPSSSSSLASPRISVLYPLNPPSTLTRVLTAPIALASGSISTRESITSDLCGTVTLSPSILRL